MTNHEALMRRAIAMADTARISARPNPWVGAVLQCADGSVFAGATQEPGREHAEVMALRAAREAGVSTIGATLYCTLEPCSHTGRTGPCTTAIIEANIAHVVIGITDPDERVSGSGIELLRAHDIVVTEGVCAHDISTQLGPYLHHRRTGRPFVVLKMASTLDAKTFLPNGPRWLTGDIARTQVHRLRALSDAIVVGRNTVEVDDPELTVRHVEGPSPRRIVLSRHESIGATARIQPCEVWSGEIESLLDELGSQGVLQLLVEGGPTIATAFHRQHLVNQYVFHISPIVSGSALAPGIFSDDEGHLEHLSITSVCALGHDIELVMEPTNMKAVVQ